MNVLISVQNVITNSEINLMVHKLSYVKRNVGCFCKLYFATNVPLQLKNKHAFSFPNHVNCHPIVQLHESAIEFQKA